MVRTRISLTATTASLIASAALAQGVATLPAPDASSDYHVSWRQQDGSIRNFVFVPANKIKPEVDVVTRRSSDGGYVFEYEIGNGDAQQKLNGCTIEVAMPTAVTRARSQWMVFQPARVAPRGSRRHRRGNETDVAAGVGSSQCSCEPSGTGGAAGGFSPNQRSHRNTIGP